MTDGLPSTKKRSVAGRIVQLFLVGLVGVLIVAAMLAVVPPSGLIKDQIEQAAAKSLGRPVTIADADITLIPEPSASLSGLTVGEGANSLLRAQVVNAKLAAKPLLQGIAEIQSLEFIKPELTLVRAADGKGNWTLGDAPGDAAIALQVPNGATFKDGVVTFASSGMKEPLRVENLDGAVTPEGKLTAKGQLIHNGEPTGVDVTIAADTSGVKPADVALVLDGRHLKGTIKGLADFKDGGALEGDVALTSGSVRDLARWLGATVADGAPVGGAVTGKIKAAASGVTFDAADVTVGADKAKLTGTLSLDGQRPKYTGNVALQKLDLNELAGKKVSAEQGAAPEAEDELELETTSAWDDLRATLQNLNATREATAGPQASPERAQTPPGANGWSTTPIDWSMLQGADIDATITSDAIRVGKLEFTNAEIKTKLDNGKLVANVQKMSLGAGSATGTISLDGTQPVARADVALNLVNVAAEPIITEITGKPLLAGTSNVEITATSEGKTQSDMASAVAGKANFRMSKGVIRGFDVRSIVSNWWNSLTGGLKFDINKKTGFEKLDAQYDIKRGVMTSSPGLDIGGNEVEVRSRGEVSLPAKRINQEIKVKVVPPPTAPPIPVKISGAWSKPKITMDWGDLLFSSGATPAAGATADTQRTASPDTATTAEDGFQELSPTAEQVPDDIKREIERVLSSDDAQMLSPEGRVLLGTLLLAEPAAQAPPADQTPTDTAPDSAPSPTPDAATPSP